MSYEPIRDALERHLRVGISDGGRYACACGLEFGVTHRSARVDHLEHVTDLLLRVVQTCEARAIAGELRAAADDVASQANMLREMPGDRARRSEANRIAAQLRRRAKSIEARP